MAKRGLLTSVRHAWRGVRSALATERNMRIHAAVGIAVMAAAEWFHVRAGERLMVWLTVALVLVAELLNTAVEVLVDCVSPEHRQEARLIKDMAAGAVLVCCVIAAMVGCAIFLPYLLR